MAKAKHPSKRISLYNGEVAVEFTPATHRYRVNGKPVRGVTSILGVINKPFLLPWAVNQTIGYIMAHTDEFKAGTEADVNKILYGAKDEHERVRDEAAMLGSAIHAWVEQHLKGQKPEMPENERAITAVMAFTEWLEGSKFKITDSERILYSRKHHYIGTCDMMGEKDGKLWLLDLKTGNQIYPEAFLQTAAYAAAFTEETGKEVYGRCILRISKETMKEHDDRHKKRGKVPPTWVPFEARYTEGPEAQEKDFNTFLHAKSLYDWQAEQK